MKKIGRTIGTIIIVLALLFPYFVEPMVVLADNDMTLNDLKKQLSDLQSEKSATEKEKKQTSAEIQNKKNASYKAYQEQQENSAKVSEAEQKIVDSEKEIERVKIETEELLRFMQQVSSGENVYLEYIAGAKSTTDLILRMATVEQLSEHNDEVLKTLEGLIVENEKLKEDLKQKNIELEQKRAQYNKTISSLGSKITELNEINEDINDQIKNQKQLISYYQGICKSDDQKLSDCIKLAADTGFVRPLAKGGVTSSFGYRTDPLTGKVNSFHNAIDIGGNSEGTPVYAAAAGMVAAVTYRSSCGGNKVYIHHMINGVAYTTQYVHLLSYTVKVGDSVTNQTIIGYVGGGKGTRGWDKCSTGAHLHFVIAKGHYLGAKPYGYSSWSTFLSKCFNPLTLLPTNKTKWTSRYN